MSVTKSDFCDFTDMKFALKTQLEMLSENSNILGAFLLGYDGNTLESITTPNLGNEFYLFSDMANKNFLFVGPQIKDGQVERIVLEHKGGKIVYQGVGKTGVLVCYLSSVADLSEFGKTMDVSCIVLSLVFGEAPSEIANFQEYEGDVLMALSNIRNRLLMNRGIDLITPSYVLNYYGHLFEKLEAHLANYIESDVASSLLQEARSSLDFGGLESSAGMSQWDYLLMFIEQGISGHLSPEELKVCLDAARDMINTWNNQIK